MKIFTKNLRKNSKTILLKTNKNDVGLTKYFPAFSKEWKNTIYSFNKNTVKNIPVSDLTINKIIKGYFNLYFKSNKYAGSKFVLLKRRRNFLRRIHVSNAEIKHTNSKAIITLYTINREKNVLKKKYWNINKRIDGKLITKRYFSLYQKNIHKFYTILAAQAQAGVNQVPGASYSSTASIGLPHPIFINDIIRKRKFIKYKLQYLNYFIKLKNLYLKKVWGIILNKYARKYLRLLRKYDLLYSINQYKFNKLVFLPVLSNILNKIQSLRQKKIEYNIINLKSIAYNTDLFTAALALKLKKRRRINYLKPMFSILHRAYLPISHNLKERAKIEGKDKADPIIEKFQDLKLLSNIGDNNLERILNEIYPMNIRMNNRSGGEAQQANEINNLIFKSIGFKKMSGIRLEVKGRLTKRYRADRSIYSLKWKGGLKNIDSSFKGLSSVLYRGNTEPNVAYSIAQSKRRIGAFAVKGWIGGK